MNMEDYFFSLPTMTVQVASVTIDGQFFAVPKYSDGAWYLTINGLTMSFDRLSSVVDAIIRLALKKASVKDIESFHCVAYDRVFTDLDDLYDYELEELKYDNWDELDEMEAM